MLLSLARRLGCGKKTALDNEFLETDKDHLSMLLLLIIFDAGDPEAFLTILYILPGVDRARLQWFHSFLLERSEQLVVSFP